MALLNSQIEQIQQKCKALEDKLHVVEAELEKLSIASQKIDAFFTAVHEETGTANLMSAIISLIGVGIITVDPEKVDEYFELAHGSTTAPELN